MDTSNENQKCASIAACPFYNDRMNPMPNNAKLLKAEFCETHCTECARFRVSRTIGKENVPLDLFPNQRERVEQIVSAFQK